MNVTEIIGYLRGTAANLADLVAGDADSDVVVVVDAEECASVATVLRTCAGALQALPTAVERYALGLLAEECGEVQQAVGKALRFSADEPAGPGGITPRQEIERELGDVIAAIRYAGIRGVVDYAIVIERANAKYARLMDPDSKDALGRRLAP